MKTNLLTRLIVGVIILLLVGCASQSFPVNIDPTQTLPAATIASSPTTTIPHAPTIIPSTPTAPLPQMQIGQVTFTILFDNNPHDPALQTDWGFACLVETEQTSVLFDTGADGTIFMKNMAALNKAPSKIDAIVISHTHSDHTGGLRALLNTGIAPQVYVPENYPVPFKDKSHADRVTRATGPMEIAPGIYTTGAISGTPVEQALVVQTSEGWVVVTGCAHPGVVKMVEGAQKAINGPIALVMGGFHLADSSVGRVDAIITQLRDLGVQKVAPTHCTGERAQQVFEQAYGDMYIPIGVGSVISFPASSSSPTPTPVSAIAPVPPTAMPSPTATPLPATCTVCASGCDFTTIQTALDDTSTTDSDIIEITDPVHTEAGITVSKNVTIRGTGVDKTIVQAHAEASQATERVFHIEKGSTATISDMTIRHGYPSLSPNSGGGIWNEGKLTLKDSNVSSNTAADGGGIWNQGELRAINCAINNNTADGIAPPGLECGSGGGINNAGGGILTLINSSLSYNKADRRGGGAHIACESTLTLVNSTVTGNTAGGNGGGINIGPLAAAQFTDSAINGNLAKGWGGGVFIRGTLDYTNTVILECVIGGPGDFNGKGSIGIHNNTTVKENDCLWRR